MPVARTLTNPPYRITASFAILLAMDVPRWFGLSRHRATLRLPSLPERHVEAIATVGPNGHQLQTATVAGDYLTSNAGREYLRQYHAELPRFLAEHGVGITRDLLIDLLDWTLEVRISDALAVGGVHRVTSFDVFGLERLEHTVQALQSTLPADSPPLVLNDDTADGESRHLAMAEYMAIDATSVTMRFIDLNDDSDDPPQTQVHVDRVPFARAMGDALADLQEMVDGIGAALGVRVRELMRETPRA